MDVPIVLDATYSVGSELSGVGIYSAEILAGLARSHPETRFRFCYRPHRWARSLQVSLPRNCTRAIFGEKWMVPPGARLFHGLNQRMPAIGFRCSVCTFHDLFVMTGDYSSPEFRARFAQQARMAAERADLIITVSAFTAMQVESLLGVERSRLRVIHHGVRILPRVDAAKEPMILHVGAIQRRKNIVRLVEAFEHIDTRWHLVLAGSPAGFGGEEVVTRIRTSPAAGRIHITGYVSERRLAELYGRASVFAFPSLDEGFGMPVLEAMAHGIPVLSSDRSALPEVCGDAARFADPESVEDMAEELTRLTEDESLRESYSSAGLRQAAQFTWDAAVEKTWAVYRELLDQ